MARTVMLYRRHAKQLQEDRFGGLAERLFGRGTEIKQTDDALFAQDAERALAFGRPCARMANVLFYVDQTVAWAEPVDSTLPPDRARAWAESFLRDDGLYPGEAEGGELQFELEARQTEGIVYDGRERRSTPVKTDVLSRVSLDGIEVTGPRAKLRTIFKTDERPVMIHAGFWERLSRHDERELISEHDVASVIMERLADRKDPARTAKLVGLRLVYWADEFSGGPDLLVLVLRRDRAHGSVVPGRESHPGPEAGVAGPGLPMT
jgi:hypothetical protein